MTRSDLQGRRVIVTRPRGRAAGLMALLEERGATPILFPTIEIAPVSDDAGFDEAIRCLDTYDWIAFTSANAVYAVAERLADVDRAWPHLDACRFAAVGPATAAALGEYGVAVDAMPATFVADRLADVMGDIRGLRIFLPQARRARPELRDMLEQRGGVVHAVAVYDTVLATPDAHAMRSLHDGVDVITFASGSAVDHFMELLGDDALHVLRGTATACIGPVTAQALGRHGLTADVVADTFTSEGLVDAIAEYLINGVSPVVSNRRLVARARPRRLRSTEVMRKLVRETALSASDFVYPLFVDERASEPKEIASMPGIMRYGLDQIAEAASEVASTGVPAVLLFGIPTRKDALGSQSHAEDGVIQRAVAQIKTAAPDLVVMTDVCLCEYTDHGHCGLLNGTSPSLTHDSLPDGYVLNDETLEVLSRIAVSHAAAGADVVAPSGMMDGKVGAIRESLDAEGYEGVAILSYAVKYASAFYGPFRDAAEGAPRQGDRRSHQMDPANAREALRETRLDVEEGADVIMVKPALPYLDVVRQTRLAHPEVPVAAYNVSGEYSMVKAAAAAGWLDERTAVMEILTSIKRAGADFIVTYHALDAATWLRG
jgi:porphobilinogen synthase